ncbi:hypothetical protein K445DRAFT_241994 [Daldinia sp. EC12]|nr:hypothetical protein K445DRAFT_241994 [Daldinia sp. EC12]
MYVAYRLARLRIYLIMYLRYIALYVCNICDVIYSREVRIIACRAGASQWEKREGLFGLLASLLGWVV